MFKTTKAIQNEAEFLEVLFQNPTDIRLKKSDYKHYHKQNPEEFYERIKEFVVNEIIPIKRFRNITNLEDKIKYYYKALTVKGKADRLFRPAMSQLYYSGIEKHLVGTDAHTMLIDGNIQIAKDGTIDNNLIIKLDDIGNIQLIPENDFEQKYPNYLAVFPSYNEDDPTFFFHNYNIDKLFFIVKCAKVCGIEFVPIKILNAYFDAYKVAHIMEVFRTTYRNADFVLHISGPNRAAYFQINYGRTKGLVMPIMFSGDVNYIEFFNP